MARAGIDRERIILAAADIADRSGAGAVTIKSVAEALGVRSPSLYNHVGSIEDLQDGLSLYGITLLREKIVEAAIGRSGHEAIREMALAYMRFARAHPGLYESIQWMNIWADPQKGEIFGSVIRLINDIYAVFGLDETETSHIIRTFRSLLHGYASIESHRGFGHSADVEESLICALDLIIQGIRGKYSI